MKVGTLFCHHVGQIRSYRAVIFFVRVANREIEVLSMVSGPVLLKIKGKSWILILLESNKTKKKGTIKVNPSNDGPQSSKRYQKDPQGRRGYFPCGDNYKNSFRVGWVYLERVCRGGVFFNCF